MKRFLIFLFITTILACTPGYKPHKIIIQADFVEIHFGRKMSRSLLDSISMILEQQGIHLAFPVVKYDGDKLNELEFLISDGIHTGTAKTNFVNKKKPFGFRVDRRPGMSNKLKVGELDELK
jgi:hypothetical protein